MNLEVLEFQYINSSSYLARGVKGNRVPHGAVGGGNGSFIMADPAKILVKVRDTSTGVSQIVDMYPEFKALLYDEGLRMSKKRAEKMVKYYQKLGSFEADDWTDWPSIPNLYGLLA